MTLHLAIYHPAIPQNTGNLGRLCVGMDAHLHIIGPCSFEISDKTLRRAGLDYWDDLSWTLYDSEADFLEWLGERQPWLVTKFGPHRYDKVNYQDGDVLVLGNENKGLPMAWHERWPERGIAIPLRGPIRSFNVANAGAMVLSHASSVCGKFDYWDASQAPDIATKDPNS